jgi:hypothetical protein
MFDALVLAVAFFIFSCGLWVFRKAEALDPKKDDQDA